MSKILLLSNGHGEDLSGSLLAKYLLKKGYLVEALPIVGDGENYKKANILENKLDFRNNINIVHSEEDGVIETNEFIRLLIDRINKAKKVAIILFACFISLLLFLNIVRKLFELC